MGGRGGGGGGGGKKSSASAVKSMVRAYARGSSLSQVAKAHGVATSTVHRNLTRAGIQLRQRGGQSRRG